MRLFVILLITASTVFGQGVRNSVGREVIFGIGGYGPVSSDGLVTIGDSSTDIRDSGHPNGFTSYTYFYLNTLFCTNTSASAVTIDITDKAASPETYADDVEIGANTFWTIPLGTLGLRMEGGVAAVASTASVIKCQVTGVLSDE